MRLIFSPDAQANGGPATVLDQLIGFAFRVDRGFGHTFEGELTSVDHAAGVARFARWDEATQDFDTEVVVIVDTITDLIYL